MSTSGGTIIVRPRCIALDPVSGGLVSLVHYKGQTSDRAFFLIRSKYPIDTNHAALEPSEWEPASEAKAFQPGAYAFKENTGPDSLGCVANGVGGFVVTKAEEKNVVGMRYFPVEDGNSVRSRWDYFQLLDKTIMEAPRNSSVTRPVWVGLKGGIEVVQAVDSKVYVIRNPMQRNNESILPLNLNLNTDPEAVVRTAFGNNILFYYRRSNGLATLTTVPLPPGTTIPKTIIPGTTTTNHPSSNNCTSEDVAGVLDNKFYYLCRSGAVLQLHDQTKLIGSNNSTSARIGTVVSFTPYDPQSPKAILLIHTQEDTQEAVGGLSLLDSSLSITNRIGIRVLAQNFRLPPLPPRPTTDPNDRGIRSSTSLRKETELLIGLGVSLFLFAICAGCGWWRSKRTAQKNALEKNALKLQVISASAKPRTTPRTAARAISARSGLPTSTAKSALAPEGLQSIHVHGVPIDPLDQASQGSLFPPLQSITFSHHPRPNVVTTVGSDDTPSSPSTSST